ncbi:hypothetical protein CU044_7121 [Streptomyces sp. L-9-10]|nr:hypothetical protein CU044_7121 [Streptomyces sp. L-9-10]
MEKPPWCERRSRGIVRLSRVHAHTPHVRAAGAHPRRVHQRRSSQRRVSPGAAP